MTVRTGKTAQQRYRRSGSSYLSQSDPRLSFGLGPAKLVDKLEVRWPSGAAQVFDKIPASRVLLLREGGEPRCLHREVLGAKPRKSESRKVGKYGEPPPANVAPGRGRDAGRPAPPHSDPYGSVDSHGSYLG